jgi:uncharacterized 2Fe-2S/4Fe-4S cluster protein (DUF4445 family)
MKITVEHSGKKHIQYYDTSVRLIDALRDMNIIIPSDCNGRGICGKCEVLAFGDLSPVTEREIKLFGPSSPLRLACLTKATGDVQIIYNTNDKRMQVLTGGIWPDIEINQAPGTGLAVDIGTTTVAAWSFDLETGNRKETFTLENPQRLYGGDVLSRMEFAAGGGLDTLKGQINKVIDDLICKTDASRVVLSGNTAMLHFAAGFSTDKMTVAPFTPSSLFGTKIDGKYFSPCVSAYFGSDIVNGIATCGMDNIYPSLIADIGTNGEMAVFDGENYYCCSTAAGPAFEGYGIDCGMPAVDSAINKVYVENGKLKYTVIGGKKPAGLCGSGIADYISCLIELGICDKSGYMEKTHHLCEEVYITPNDIRNFQLAKAAIRAGIETLLEISSTAGNIKAFYLAGGLGNSVDIECAVKLGLVPDEFKGIAIPAGNTSLTGAAASLLSEKFSEKAKNISKQCKVIELADSEIFADNFIKYMSFGG